MSYRHTFTYPEYYPEFACKCGDCRATCCHGWGIALSQDEYFRVMGTDCSPELRRRLDVAFRPATNPAPTEERYALISYNWLGMCPIQNEEGLCMLHRECGEGAIPEICRRYPRCVRVLPTHECCTSNACEATLELLWRDTKPLSFASGEQEIFDEHFDAPAAAALDESEYTKVRRTAFDVISHRELSIDGRIEKLAHILGAKLPYYIMPFERITLLFEKLCRTSDSLAELSDDCTAYYADGSGIARFVDSDEKKREAYTEKLLANHLFYKAFPRSFVGSDASQELAALIAVRALHRYVYEAYLAVHGDSFENFVDVTAKLFRMVEHSRFDEVASRFVLSEAR